MDVNKRVGTNIKLYRELRGLTQEALAHYAEMSASQFGAIERGKTNVTIKTLEKIALPLHIESELLLKTTSEPSVSQLQLSAYQVEFERLSAAKQEKILRILKELISFDSE